MKQNPMKTASLAVLSPLPLTLVAAACGGMDPAATTPPQHPGRSAGNVGLGITADRSDTEIAALRAAGPPALAKLLAAYDQMPAGAARAALAATIDRVAAQRYATVSRLYWYTDLDAARVHAAAAGKPILSLRMLGRLDEDLSCANSRFFRTILYPDPAIAAILRDKFILHWSSERPVPRVTIDFGDGRKLERTVTGNSIHYVLDASGVPIDALPGLYAPSVFAEELGRSLALHRRWLFTRDRDARIDLLRTYHAQRNIDRASQWAVLGNSVTYDLATDQVLTGKPKADALARAQQAAMSKARVEAPELGMIDIGPDPGALLPDVDTWAKVGQAVFGFGPPAALPEPPPYALGTREYVVARRRGAARPAPVASAGLLSAPAKALIAQVMRRDAGAVGGAVHDVDRVIGQLERSLIADTAMNELQIRRQIHDRFAVGDIPRFDALNRFVYDELFATPAADRWLGLLPRDVYTGLPGDGVVTP